MQGKNLSTINKTKNNWQLFDYQLKTLVIGLGESGFSCAKFLAGKGCSFDVCDTRDKPPYLAQLQNLLGEHKILCNARLNEELLQQYKQILVSPGVSIRDKEFIKLKQQGVTIIGDIALFIQENLLNKNKPVIAVTGSNGKSTVVTLAEHILKTAGYKVFAGGNLGIAALDLLEEDADIYVLELSSFQLETIPDKDFLLQQDMDPQVFISSVLLNVSEDHMDRYESIDDYRRVKETIFNYSKHCVVNKNEWLLNEAIKNEPNRSFSEFSLNLPGKNGYGMINENGSTYLAHALCCQDDPLIKKIILADDIAISGKHNLSNILATLALLEPLALADEHISTALKTYKGLAHRCEWVATIAGVDYYNDSKGTNAGATIAAINSYDKPKLLIAGGVGKNADFSELGKLIKQKIKHLILMGEDAEQIKNAVEQQQDVDNEKYQLQSIEMVENMEQAVIKAEHLAKEGELVLFSPACASFDMYKNYIERGQDFINKVKDRQKQNN